MRSGTLLLASYNRGKAKEFAAILKHYPEVTEVISVADVIANPEKLAKAETGTTYFENAYNKARLVFMATGLPTISDDSGLEVDALDGRPGLYSERYAKASPGESKDAANTKKLLEELHGLPPAKRTARFVCTVVFMVEGLALSTTGTLEGVIIETPKGTRGFGFDPVFQPTGHTKTLAELSEEEKDQISHRAKAIHAMMKLLREKGVALI